MASDDEFYDYDYDYDDDEDEASEEEEEDDAGDLADEDDGPVQEPPVKCSAITKEALSYAQQEDLSMVMNLFNIKQHQARAVLIRYRWNKESITDHIERKGQDVMLMEAGVVLRQEEDHDDGAVAPRAAGSSSVTCWVCFEDFSSRSRRVSTMDCGHSFCNDCWIGYFVSSLDSGKKQIRCMAPKCPAICDESVVQRLLRRDHPAAADRFLDFLLQSYVDDNAAVRWCPSVPHCGRAVRCESAAPLATLPCEVECPCGRDFCFRCLAAAHSPCPCAVWDRWEAKGRGEAENVKWLLVNTRTCPKCFKPIVKDGGCNHVTCSCGQSLCWLCGAATGLSHDINRIFGHSCNRFDEDERKKVSDARRELRRYEHYYKLVQAHDASHRSERGALGPALACRLAEMEETHDAVMHDAAAKLADAHRSLLLCRQVLSRSFVFAYYMFDDDVPKRPPPPEEAAGRAAPTLAQAQELFENYQEEMGTHVERLSKLLEETANLQMPKEEELKLQMPNKEEELLLAKMQEALNLAVAIEGHCRNMYAFIQDDLLPMLVEQPMAIAAFQKKGPSKAHEEELPT